MLMIGQLKEGSYYMPVFERIEPQGTEFCEQYRTDSPFFQYLGNGQFATEDGEPVEGFYDPELGIEVAVDAPDGFIQ